MPNDNEYQRESSPSQKYHNSSEQKENPPGTKIDMNERTSRGKKAPLFFDNKASPSVEMSQAVIENFSKISDNTNHRSCPIKDIIPSSSGSFDTICTNRTADTIDENVDLELDLLHADMNATSEVQGNCSSPGFNSSTSCINDTTSLDDDGNSDLAQTRLHAKRVAERFRYWQDHTHAVGLVPISWADEEEELDSFQLCKNATASPDIDLMTTRSQFSLSQMFEYRKTKTTLRLCRCFGRVGNMVVIKGGNTWIPLPTYDIDGGSEATEVAPEPKFVLVLGPYWPVLLCFTLPLIIVLSAVTAFLAVFVPDKSEHPCSIISLWMISTLGMFTALCYTSFVDPGILPRHKERPAKHWRWNDNAQSFIPPDAIYEPDCKVVIEKYHHTCLYTGTAIGKNNKTSFLVFVVFATLCLVQNIMLLIVRT